MNVSITAPLFDLDGHEFIQANNQEGITEFSRRNSRIPTLDGSSAINDFGYSDSDRTFDIRWVPKSEYQFENIRRMVKSYSRLVISTPEGCFIGAPETFNFSENTIQLRILIERRLDQ
jgi:hypothetical protein